MGSTWDSMSTAEQGHLRDAGRDEGGRHIYTGRVPLRRTPHPYRMNPETGWCKYCALAEDASCHQVDAD